MRFTANYLITLLNLGAGKVSPQILRDMSNTSIHLRSVADWDSALHKLMTTDGVTIDSRAFFIWEYNAFMRSRDGKGIYLEGDFPRDFYFKKLPTSVTNVSIL